jgi:DNA-binding CsgD family transcriptional regulator
MDGTNDQVAYLASQGETYKSIASRLGITLWKAWTRGRQHGSRRRPVVTDRQRAKVRRLVSTSLSLREIASRAGVSKDLVRRERVRYAPTAPETAKAKRCPCCGAKINTYTCVACSLRGS